MQYRLLLPKDKKLILPEGHIKNTGDDDASLSITGPYPALRQDMLTRLTPNSTPLEQFQYAAEQYYLRKIDKDAFAKTCLRLHESSKQIREILPEVAKKFDHDQGFEAIQLIHRTFRQSP